MITYPVPEGSKWAVYRVSTGQIISRNNNWPRADGMEIEGQDPDYVMLLQIDAAIPDYDSRIYSLSGVEVVDVEGNQLRKTWNAVKRPTEEQIVAAENVEAEQLGRQIDLVREAMTTRLMVAALLNYTDGLTMPAKVQEMANEYKAVGIKLWKNRDRLNQIIAQIQANQEPDLDYGWEPAP